MSEQSPTTPPNNFDPIHDSQEINRYFTECIKHFSSANIWEKDQSEVIHTHLTLLSKSEQIFYAWIPKDFNLKQFIIRLQANHHECIFNVSLPYAQIFFKTSFAGHDSAGLRFHIPQTVYKIQRRKNARFKIPDQYVLKVEFKDPLFPEISQKKKVIDISAGGLAFLTAGKDLTVYQPGMLISELTLKIYQKRIISAAEVRHAKFLPNQPDDKNVKVGVLYVGLKSTDENLIASYVMDETSKHFAKLLY